MTDLIWSFSPWILFLPAGHGLTAPNLRTRRWYSNTAS